eukprot:Gb_03678 [translate_table: standard]
MWKLTFDSCNWTLSLTKELPRSHGSLGELFARHSDKMGMVLKEGGCLYWFSLEEKLTRPAIMGGELVTTEPSVLIVDEDVQRILEETGILSFFKNFSGHSKSITNQFIESWKDGRVVVSGMDITVNEALIADVLGLPNEGEVVSRDKMNQVIKYLTLEGKFRKLFGYHIAILNSMRNKEKINIPLFLYKSLEKSMPVIKIDPSEEDQKFKDPDSLGGRRSPPKVSAVAPLVKSEKSPVNSLSLSEELQFHL